MPDLMGRRDSRETRRRARVRALLNRVLDTARDELFAVFPAADSAPELQDRVARSFARIAGELEPPNVAACAAHSPAQPAVSRQFSFLVEIVRAGLASPHATWVICCEEQHRL